MAQNKQKKQQGWDWSKIASGLNIFVVLKIVAIVLLVGGAIYLFAGFHAGLLFLIGGCALFLYSLNNGNISTTIEKTVMPALKASIAPAVGLLLSFIVGAIVMLFARYNPIQGYSALIYGGFIRNWDVTILNAVPLIFTGLAVAVAFQAGLFNIGAEGQYYVGAMATAVIGIYLDIPPIIGIPLIIIGGGLCAALYTVIPSILKVKTGAHEVITTMMFAHIARVLSPLVVRNFGGHTTSPHPLKTYEISQNLFLPLFAQFFENAYYRLHIGILLAVAAAIAIHLLIWQTPLGFEIRAVGKNRFAAKAQGISIAKIYTVTLMISGFLAGLSGVMQVIGLEHKLTENLNAGYGWNGISVALLAGNRPIAVIFTALLWGALDSGGQYMQRTVEIPSSVVEIIKGVVLFLMVAKVLYVDIYKKYQKNKQQKGGARRIA